MLPRSRGPQRQSSSRHKQEACGRTRRLGPFARRPCALRPFLPPSSPLFLPLLLVALLLPCLPLPSSSRQAAPAGLLLVSGAAGGACRSGLKCENGGVCVHSPRAGDMCRCPRPASALEPSFFVGSKCHIPAVMCADTETFYCANGASCVEVVQGENYTCQGCNSAVAGPHCDAEGVPCGANLKCFNGGTCSQAAGACVCPPAWSGNENCTAPGLDGSESTSEDEEQTWYVPLLGALGALAVILILGALIYFCYGHKEAAPGPTSLNAIKDAEEALSLQEHGDGNEEEEVFELAEVSDHQRLQPEDHEPSA